MELTYYHPDHGVAVPVHVDDPLVISPNSTASDWTHDFMDKHFETKGRSTLAAGAPITIRHSMAVHSHWSMEEQH